MGRLGFGSSGLRRFVGLKLVEWRRGSVGELLALGVQCLLLSVRAKMWWVQMRWMKVSVGLAAALRLLRC